MKVRFPAMQATIGQRTYYACVMKLEEIPKMFTFRDWIEFTPEDREQRVLDKTRIPDIARYFLDNEDGYLFSSITASYKCVPRFESVNAEGLGILEMDLAEAEFVINDGQHRCAAIAQAIRENPALGKESISVLLFDYENKHRVQQMFTDLNRYTVKTNNATNIIFDHHDKLARVIKEVCEQVPVFQGMVDKEHQSLPARSEKAFTLYSLYDATKELVADKANSPDVGFDQLVMAAVDYWTTVSQYMPDWLKVKNRELRSIELRQENISTHSVVLRALGGVGAELVRQYPTEWKSRLADLRAVNWSKRNRDWENVCMVANSVVANRQARVATKAYLKRKLGLSLTEAEQKANVHFVAADVLFSKVQTEGVSSDPLTRMAVNGNLTPHDFLVILIEVLKTLKGRARKPDVDEEAFRRMKAVFSQPYWQQIDQGGVPRWQKDLAWAKEKAKQQELVEPVAVAGHGWWQLTRKGWDFDART